VVTVVSGVDNLESAQSCNVYNMTNLSAIAHSDEAACGARFSWYWLAHVQAGRERERERERESHGE
jgi:hypothetical protein